MICGVFKNRWKRQFRFKRIQVRLHSRNWSHYRSFNFQKIVFREEIADFPSENVALFVSLDVEHCSDYPPVFLWSQSRDEITGIQGFQDVVNDPCLRQRVCMCVVLPALSLFREMDLAV